MKVLCLLFLISGTVFAENSAAKVPPEPTPLDRNFQPIPTHDKTIRLQTPDVRTCRPLAQADRGQIIRELGDVLSSPLAQFRGTEALSQFLLRMAGENKGQARVVLEALLNHLDTLEKKFPDGIESSDNGELAAIAGEIAAAYLPSDDLAKALKNRLIERVGKSAETLLRLDPEIILRRAGTAKSALAGLEALAIRGELNEEDLKKLDAIPFVEAQRVKIEAILSLADPKIREGRVTQEIEKLLKFSDPVKRLEQLEPWLTAPEESIRKLALDKLAKVPWVTEIFEMNRVLNVEKVWENPEKRPRAEAFLFAANRVLQNKAGREAISALAKLADPKLKLGDLLEKLATSTNASAERLRQSEVETALGGIKSERENVRDAVLEALHLGLDLGALFEETPFCNCANAGLYTAEYVVLGRDRHEEIFSCLIAMVPVLGKKENLKKIAEKVAKGNPRLMAQIIKVGERLFSALVKYEGALRGLARLRNVFEPAWGKLDRAKDIVARLRARQPLTYQDIRPFAMLGFGRQKLERFESRSNLFLDNLNGPIDRAVKFLNSDPKFTAGQTGPCPPTSTPIEKTFDMVAKATQLELLAEEKLEKKANFFDRVFPYKINPSHGFILVKKEKFSIEEKDKQLVAKNFAALLTEFQKSRKGREVSRLAVKQLMELE